MLHINISNRWEVLHRLSGVKYDVSNFHEILIGNSHQVEVPGRFNIRTRVQYEKGNENARHGLSNMN